MSRRSLLRSFGGGYSDEYQAVLDYATTNGITHPSSAQNIINDTKVRALVTAGAFTEFDNFWMFEQVADLDFKRINWVNPSNYYLTDFSATPLNADGGVYTNATNQALNTNYIPNTDAVKCLKQDSSLIFKPYGLPTTYDFQRNLLAARTGNNDSQTIVANNSSNSMLLRTSGNTDTGLLSFGGLQAQINSHFHADDLLAVRNNYLNGALVNTGTNQTVGTLTTLTLALLGFNNNGSTTSSSGSGLAYVGFGASMRSIQLDIYNALNP